VSKFRLQPAANARLDDIYRHTSEQWGEEQAERYLAGLFARFAEIAERKVVWRPVPAAFGQPGYVCRCERHLIYFRELADGTVGIVTILHERMHLIERFREDFR
jgi:toxin ParE1/3/4